VISAVLDTNVLASGTVSAANAPGQIIDAWHARKFELVTSTHIIGELSRTFQKPYFKNHLTNKAVTNFIDLLQNEAFVIPIIVKVVLSLCLSEFLNTNFNTFIISPKQDHLYQDVV